MKSVYVIYIFEIGEEGFQHQSLNHNLKVFNCQLDCHNKIIIVNFFFKSLKL